ncbi:MAG: dipeptide epimerase [Actinobacteria bacterium]|nr:dipeptide epimerase [Actinomycetota bacterium]
MVSLSSVGADKFSIRGVAANLELAERFTIAVESWDVASNVFAIVSYGDHTGVGEVCPDARWGDSADSVLKEIAAVDLNGLASPFDLEGLSHLMPATAARCAVDIAMHDLAAKIASVSVAEMLGLGGRSIPETSVTVPIADLDVMVARARKLAAYPAMKLKVGFDGDVDAVRAIREVYDGRIRIDANEGWSADQAIERLDALAELDIELCEQPVPKGDYDGWSRVKERSSIPIFADEDAGTAEDVAKLAGRADGVNLKLRKAGGIRELVKGTVAARALGMGVMIGCDLESGIAATAGASAASLCDFVDLDGPLLLATDPYPGVRYDGARLSLPDAPGLGIEKAPE